MHRVTVDFYSQLRISYSIRGKRRGRCAYNTPNTYWRYRGSTLPVALSLSGQPLPSSMGTTRSRAHRIRPRAPPADHTAVSIFDTRDGRNTHTGVERWDVTPLPCPCFYPYPYLQVLLVPNASRNGQDARREDLVRAKLQLANGRRRRQCLGHLIG